MFHCPNFAPVNESEERRYGNQIPHNLDDPRMVVAAVARGQDFAQGLKLLLGLVSKQLQYSPLLPFGRRELNKKCVCCGATQAKCGLIAR